MKYLITMLLALTLCAPAFSQTQLNIDTALNTITDAPKNVVPAFAPLARGLMDVNGKVLGNTTGGVLALNATTTIGGSTVSALGTITSNSATALAVGRNGATNPVFVVDNSTSSAATGIKVKGAAAAAGVAITTVSSGTNESATLDAKGTGTLTLNGTATGATIIPVTRARSEVTNYTADGAITLTSGVHTIAKASAAAMTVAAPSSVNGTRMTIISNTDFAHVITFTGATLLDGTTGANTTVTMTAFKGSAITVIAVGATWLLESSSNVTSIAP